jgi:hypothetical protein
MPVLPFMLRPIAHCRGVQETNAVANGARAEAVFGVASAVPAEGHVVGFCETISTEEEMESGRNALRIKRIID